MHLPFLGSVFSVNIWLMTVAVAVLVLRGNHSNNHSHAQARNSALSGLRKSVSGFWNTQTLERVHLKWRREQNRSVYSKNLENNILLYGMYTNRLPAAWRALSKKRGKTTVVWLSALFFLL